MNIITLVGNLCRDFTAKTTSNGKTIASNAIAVKRDRKEADGTYATDFFNLSCFGAQAEYATKYLKKGDKVAISGSLHINDYVSKNGAQNKSIDIMVSSIENLTTKQKEETTEEPEVDVTDDDLPW